MKLVKKIITSILSAASVGFIIPIISCSQGDGSMVSIISEKTVETDYKNEATYKFKFNHSGHSLPDEYKIYAIPYDTASGRKHERLISSAEWSTLQPDYTFDVKIKFSQPCLKSETENFALLFWYYCNGVQRATVLSDILSIKYTANTGDYFQLSKTNQIFISKGIGSIDFKSKDIFSGLYNDELFVSLTSEDGGNLVKIDDLEAGQEKRYIWRDVRNPLTISNFSFINEDQKDVVKINLTFRYKIHSDDKWTFCSSDDIFVIPQIKLKNIESLDTDISFIRKDDLRYETNVSYQYKFEDEFGKAVKPSKVRVSIQGDEHIWFDQDKVKKDIEDDLSSGNEFTHQLFMDLNDEVFKQRVYTINLLFSYEIGGEIHCEGTTINISLPDYVFGDTSTPIHASNDDSYVWPFVWQDTKYLPKSGYVDFSIIRSSAQEMRITFDNGTSFKRINIDEITESYSLTFIEINNNHKLVDDYDITVQASYDVDGEPRRVQTLDLKLTPFDDKGFLKFEHKVLPISETDGNVPTVVNWVSERRPTDNLVSLSIDDTNHFVFHNESGESVKNIQITLQEDQGQILPINLPIYFDDIRNEILETTDIQIKATFTISGKQREITLPLEVLPRTRYIDGFEDYSYYIQRSIASKNRGVIKVFFNWKGMAQVKDQNVQLSFYDDSRTDIKFNNNTAEGSDTSSVTIPTGMQEGIYSFELLYTGEKQALKDMPEIQGLGIKFTFTDDADVVHSRVNFITIKPAGNDFVYWDVNVYRDFHDPEATSRSSAAHLNRHGPDNNPLSVTISASESYYSNAARFSTTTFDMVLDNDYFMVAKFSMGEKINTYFDYTISYTIAGYGKINQEGYFKFHTW